MPKFSLGLITGALLLATSACFGATVDSTAVPTFSKDIAPILQRSCQKCHNDNGVAPMSLITYQDARPWARAIKQRTALRDKRGAMPPWFIEKTVGIQHYKDDVSLTDDEIETIAKWADNGAPEGNPSDLPPTKVWDDNDKWTLGQPDLIISTPEDRWVKSVEIREVNDIKKDPNGRKTVGGRYIFHHMIWGTSVPGAMSDYFDNGFGDWPVHEVGRNADVFPDAAGKLLKAGSEVDFLSAHIHSNGQDVKARLLYGFKFFPKDYKPEFKYAHRSLGDGVDINIHANEAGQRLDAYQVLEEPTKIVSFEPHLHAPGMRMCLEYIWGINIQTLSCSGYDHNWVRVYEYDDDYAPLLPKGTILHIIGYMDNTAANTNVPDPRNWSGSGNRSISNMFIDLGQSLSLTDDQFYAEMAKRKAKLHLSQSEVMIGCPLCNTDIVPPPMRKKMGPAPEEKHEGAGAGAGTGGSGGAQK
jgi:hypothetical protein